MLSDPTAFSSEGIEALLLLVTDIVEDSYFSDREYDERLWTLMVQFIKRLEQHTALRRDA